jgi:hypothetical protein
MTQPTRPRKPAFTLIAVALCASAAGLLVLHFTETRRLRRDLSVEQAKNDFLMSKVGTRPYDSVYARGDTVSFYKDRKLVRFYVTTQQ